MSDEVLMWVNQKYGMSQIMQQFYSFEINNCSYLTVNNDDQPNLLNNETYNR